MNHTSHSIVRLNQGLTLGRNRHLFLVVEISSGGNFSERFLREEEIQLFSLQLPPLLCFLRFPKLGTPRYGEWSGSLSLPLHPLLDWSGRGGEQQGKAPISQMDQKATILRVHLHKTFYCAVD